MKSHQRLKSEKSLSIEMNYQGVEILKYFIGGGEEREQGGGGDLQELCAGQGEHC